MLLESVRGAAALVASKEIGSEQIPRVRLQRLEKCLDQKVIMVRQQSTGSTA